MDHWGDPWADNNVEQQKSPTKDAVISPPPPTLAPAPVLLNGFLDDAGWGNEDESFGDWTNSTGAEPATVPYAEPQILTPSRLKNDELSEDIPRWDVDESTEDAVAVSDRTWTRETPDSFGLDNGASDTSETSTTVPTDPDPDAHRDTNEPPTQSQPDDASSARPSTSQSETSRHAAPVESPRTSLEEEQIIGKYSVEERKSSGEHGSFTKRQGEEEEDDASSSGTDSAEDGYGTSTADTLLTEGPQGQDDATEIVPSDSKEDIRKSRELRTEPTVAPPSASTTVASTSGKGVYQLDTSVLDELFPPQKSKVDLKDAPEDPIYSTSARKAWYRLTRKQTMREFNSGNSDDSYIRVTWLSSQIRSEVHKTVARWAREDRMSGTGPGAGASFYWDTPAPIEPKMPRGHQRTKTSVPTQRVTAPMRQSLPPVATNTAAAFNWNSPTSTIDPWKQDGPSLHSRVSSATSNPIAAHGEQTKEFRAPSMELGHGVGETKKQQSVISPETPAVASTIPPPPPVTTSEDSWGDFNAPETNTTVREQHATIPDDEDDDWGEMISSPTISAPVSAFPSSTSTPPNDTVSPFAPAPDTSLIQDPSADAMHAASIVRLKSTISPTSAIFGRKSFIPLGAEPGPIGPGILKPAKRPVNSTPEKPKKERLSESPHSTLSGEPSIPKARNVEDAYERPVQDPEHPPNDAKDDFSIFESSAPESGVAHPSTPPQPPVQNEPIVDSWADADFSIFESAPTAATTDAKPKSEPLDSFSILQTPPRSTSSASSAKTFTRSSPPRNVTPPAIQPLTGATNSAQRRKNEEERIIRDILAGLPDLSYMLRR